MSEAELLADMLADPKYTHPAPQATPQPLSDEQIKDAIYKQCPDFDEWHEGPSIDDVIAIVKAAHGIFAEPAQDITKE